MGCRAETIGNVPNRAAVCSPANKHRSSSSGNPSDVGRVHGLGVGLEFAVIGKAIACASLTCATASAETPAIMYTVKLSADAEVISGNAPDLAGDDDGSGTVRLTVDMARNQIC